MLHTRRGQRDVVTIKWELTLCRAIIYFYCIFCVFVFCVLLFCVFIFLYFDCLYFSIFVFCISKMVKEGRDHQMGTHTLKDRNILRKIIPCQVFWVIYGMIFISEHEFPSPYHQILKMGRGGQIDYFIDRLLYNRAKTTPPSYGHSFH